jgi:hypothetical protein
MTYLEAAATDDDDDDDDMCSKFWMMSCLKKK